MTQLERIPVSVPAPVAEANIDPLRAELASKAECLLGYNLLAEHLKGGPPPSRAEQVLNELDIQPFNPAAVAEYQAQAVKTENRKSFRKLPLYAKIWKLIDDLANKLDEGPGVATGIISIISTILFGICALGRFFIDGPGHWESSVMPYTFPGVFVVALMLYVGILNDTMRRHNITTWRWQELQFVACSRYGIAIPDFALDTATRIREKLDHVEADLYIEVLQADTRQLGHDPFLVMQVGNKKYYLEVWEESKFEAANV